MKNMIRYIIRQGKLFGKQCSYNIQLSQTSGLTELSNFNSCSGVGPIVIFSFLHASSTDQALLSSPYNCFKDKKHLIGSSLGFWSRSQFINALLNATLKSQVPKVPKQHQSMHLLVSTQCGNTFIKCEIAHYSPRLDILLLKIPFCLQ